MFLQRSRRRNSDTEVFRLKSEEIEENHGVNTNSKHTFSGNGTVCKESNEADVKNNNHVESVASAEIAEEKFSANLSIEVNAEVTVDKETIDESLATASTSPPCLPTLSTCDPW